MMRTSPRFALSIGAAALFAGCGGSQPPIGANITSAGTQAPSHHRIFHYTGGEQSFEVPPGVTDVRILATGGVGSSGDPPTFASRRSGGGAAVTLGATIPVTPGERLAVFVGGSGITGGFNGGSGSGCEPGRRCYGRVGAPLTYGGGATDWVTALSWARAAGAAALTVAGARLTPIASSTP
ncbi:MAG: hypothetical protein WBE77_02465 [Candidatus Cybelea sp.]